MSSLLKQGALAAGLLGVTAVFSAPSLALKCTTTGGVGCESDDGQFATEFGGRIQVDANFFDDDINENSDGAQFRRLRFFNKFQLYGRYIGKIQIDFEGDGDVDIEDAYIGVKDLLFRKGSRIASDEIHIGNEKIPFSLNELTSSKYLTFVERSFLTEIPNGTRQIGIGHHTVGAKQATVPWTTFFRVWTTDDTDQGSDDTDSAGNENSDGIGVGFRGTLTPQFNNGFVHLGGWYNHESNNDLDVFDDGDVEPEANLADDIDVFGNISPTQSFDINRYGVEAALVTGPFSVQAEYQSHNYDDDAGFDQDLEGFYVFSSLFLTPGDHRGYKNGSFARVKPKNDYGAFEVALRYSLLENDDVVLPNGENLEVEGLTAALNWYVNSHVRVMFNYVRPDITAINEENGAFLDGDSPNIFLLRFQADYGD